MFRFYKLLVLLLLGLPFGAKAAETSGKARLLTAEGTVQVMRAGSSAWTNVTAGTPVAVRDRVRTGAKSRATVQLLDFSIIRIAPLTTFELVPSTSDKPVIDVKSGSLYFFSRQKPDDVRFRTPSVSGAIRGTEFTVNVAENGASEVILIDGQVALQQDGNELLLNSGERAVAPSSREMTRQPLLNAQNRIQWVLYYPAVLDPAEVEAGTPLEAYRTGDLIKAVQDFEGPTNSLYSAALNLGFGDVTTARAIVQDLPETPARRGLQRLIAAVQFTHHGFTNEPASATEWLGESYYQQSLGKLDSASAAAASATELSPSFGFAWSRLAELDFAHGRSESARQHLNRSLELAPQNAHAHAIQGFIRFAQYQPKEAIEAFNQAINLNGALGSAWLGRGLVKMKAGDTEGGRQDIQTAVALEPQRAVFRAYLGKAFAQENRFDLAKKDLRLARQIDAADPTAWLYTGILDQQQNRINPAITNLQQAINLNDNQLIHRSTFLLDQDRATKSANLASVYRDAGMLPLSLSQASRGVSYDYANYSTHLFLAQSYDLLSDPNKYNLRYETARLSELYLASLLSPVGGFNLSQNVGSLDASRLFEQNRFGISSETEYLSRGTWNQSGSQFGTIDQMAYSLDAFYRTDNGQRPNNDLEQRTLSLQAKYQLNYRDSVYVQALHHQAESGDVVQRYNQADYNSDVRIREDHEPDLFAGFHREWNPGNHTLLFFGRSDLSLQITDPDVALLFFRRLNGTYTRIQPAPWHRLEYERDYELYSAEAQQIWQTGRRTYIAGARYQTADFNTTSSITDVFNQPRSIQDQNNDFYRLTLYGYQQWRILDSLLFTAGLAFDRMHYPRNVDSAPLSEEEDTVQHLSPKAGLQYTPWKGGTLRAAFTRSLGGVSLDNNLRLEPTQVGGFNQAYRSLLPESVAGIAYGEEFQTISAGYDHAFPTQTFVGIEAEHLSSEADRTFGILTSGGFLPVPDTAASTHQQIDFVERALRLYTYQLLGRDFTAGVRYRLSHADLDSRLPEVLPTLPQSSTHLAATLQEVVLSLIWNHPSGFFSQVESAFYTQDNENDLPGPGDDFWQQNIYFGYRFAKRAAELRLGILNLSDQDYQLNPLNVHLELPRDRTFTARLRLNF